MPLFCSALNVEARLTYDIAKTIIYPARQPYIVSVRGHGDGTLFEWISAPQREDTKRELEEISRKLVTDRYDWLDKLRTLVATVKGWAENLGWATKVVEKKMEDACSRTIQTEFSVSRNECKNRMRGEATGIVCKTEENEAEPLSLRH